MEEAKSGEVRRLADVFAPQEVERASTHLQSALDSHRQTLRTLQTFLRDNQELTKLVQDLPKKISHHIMVPFGKAAFFPGRLMHTNELLVLLGEGYYAECTATQTLEILDRRGSFLGSQIDGVKHQLADLDVESRFFKETLAEASAGFVEIREDFVEPLPSRPAVEFGVSTENDEAAVKAEVGSRVEDEEHQRLMARLEELEAAEAAAESDEDERFQEDTDMAEQDVTGELELVKQDPLELPTQCQERGTAVPRYPQVNEQPSPRGEVGGQLRQDDAVASHKRAIKARPVIQCPGDLLKFEEWRRSNFEQGSMEQVSKEVHKKTCVSPLPRKPETGECRKAGPSPDLPLPRKGDTPEYEKAGPSTSQEPRSSAAELPRIAHGLHRESKAFTGMVLERSGPQTFSTVEEQPQGPKQVEKRPTSKFKLRQRGT